MPKKGCGPDRLKMIIVCKIRIDMEMEKNK